MKFKRLFLGLIFILIFYGCRAGREIKDKKEALRQGILIVKADTVKEGYIARKLIYYGRVYGKEQAYVYPDLPGKLIKYTVKEGDFVKKGQVIALLDRNLPGMEYKPLKVKSPISGIVALEYKKRGEMCIQTQPIALVVNPEELQIEIMVPQNEVLLIRPGMKAIIYDEYGKKEVSKVKFVSRAIDPVTQMAKVTINVPQGLKLLPGMSVKVKIILEEKRKAILVPLSSIVKIGGKRYIFVVQNGKAKRRAVEIGIISGDTAEVKAGVKSGELVVTEGAVGLADGQKVEVSRW